MVDTLSPKARSERMSKVRSQNTKPELFVRRLIHMMGYRFRLHVAELPGKPDLVFRRLGKVLFVHGCFWHRHKKRGCRLARMPKSNAEFWTPKLEANRLRDLRSMRSLRAAGRQVLVVWECELRHIERLENKIRRFLEDENAGNRAFRGRGRARNRG